MTFLLVPMYQWQSIDAVHWQWWGFKGILLLTTIYYNLLMFNYTNDLSLFFYQSSLCRLTIALLSKLIHWRPLIDDNLPCLLTMAVYQHRLCINLDWRYLLSSVSSLLVLAISWLYSILAVFRFLVLAISETVFPSWLALVDLLVCMGFMVGL